MIPSAVHSEDLPELSKNQSMCNREDFIDYTEYDEDNTDDTFEDLIYEMSKNSCHYKKP